jgi:hypothetical protein
MPLLELRKYCGKIYQRRNKGINLVSLLDIVMKKIFFAILVITVSCSQPKTNNNKMNFTEKEILTELDLGFNGTPSPLFPKGLPTDIKYNFFLDLEHGYCNTASSRIHLFADSLRWAIVFEKSGYQNRATRAEIELNYFGNCINYPVDKYPEQNYISNTANIVLITSEEFERIENKEGTDMETFELIDNTIKEAKVREQIVPFENDYKKYQKLGIKIRDYDNSKKLIDFEGFIRYLNETNPKVISATDEEIRKHIPTDMPKLITIDEFHYSSIYEKNNPPSYQELFQLIAKILVTKNITNWKPTQKVNNHWSQWESGNL